MAGPSGVRVAISAALSLDGKLSTVDRAPVTFTSPADRARLFGLRDAADAILIGAGTLRAEDPPLLPSRERADARQATGRRRWPVRVVVSRSLDFPLGRALRDPSDEAPVVVVTGRVADTRRATRLRAHAVDVIDCSVGARSAPHEESEGQAAQDLLFEEVLRTLSERFDVRDLLCEGGGALNAALLAEGLVDALHVTLCPLILGGDGAPTLADGPALDLPRARLTALEQVGQEVFLSYALASPPGGGVD